MKPMRLLVIVALVGVAALIYLLMVETRDERGRDRRGDVDSRRESVDRTRKEGGRGIATARQRDAGTLLAKLKIVLPDGSAAGGAELMLRGRGESGYTAGSDGAVEFTGLYRGLYNVIARSGDAVGALDFELKETTDLGTLKLTESVAIRGRVLDSQGAAIVGATVEATRAAEQQGLNMTSMVRILMSPEQIVAHTTSADDGAYELLVPKAGSYALRASAKGFAQEAESARPFTATVEGIDFYLFPGLLAAGRVTEPNGSPVAGATVMLVDPMSAFGKQLPKVETTTASDGSFAITATPSRQLLLIVRASGFATHMDSNIKLPALDLQIKLEEGISVRLKAVDKEQTAVPAPGVSVAVMYRGGFAAGETDEFGELLLNNLPIKGSRMWGSQQTAILWGGEFVAHMAQLGSMEPENGELDIGTIELTRGGVVTGKVTDRSTGKPVSGVRLRALGGLDQQLTLLGAVTTNSAKDGTYKLTGVPPKAHTILTIHPDYVSNFDPTQMIMSMRGGAGTTPLFTGTALKAERNIELVPAESVIGQVLGPDGNPVAGAKVQIQDPMAMMRMMLGGGTTTAISDADGNFVLKGLKQGQSVKIHASHRDFGRSELTEGKAGEDVALTLTEPLLLTGQVVDEAGNAVSGVRITVERAQNPSRGSGMMAASGMETGAARPAVTDAAGKFTVRNAPPGKLTVTYEHGEFESMNRTINVAPGTSEHELGKSTLKRGLGIEGIVVDESGKPLPGVTLNANWDYAGGATPEDSTGRMNGQARSDEQGRFRMYGLRQGTFQLRTWQQGFYAKAPKVETGTTDVRVVMEKAAKLVGRVTSNGRPVANANLNAEVVKPTGTGGEDTEQIGWGRTDVDGVFRMETLPRETPFRLTIRHDSFKTRVVKGVIASDLQQSYRLDAGIRVGGIVRESDGTPIPNVTISITVSTESGNNQKSVRTDADGRFEAGGLDDGEIKVELARWNGDYIPIEPIIATPGDTSIRIVAKKGGAIGGTVVDAGGNPIKQINVVALDADANEVGSAWVWKDDGRFDIRGLPKGTYTIRASRWIEGKSEVMAVIDDVRTGTDDLELREQR